MKHITTALLVSLLLLTGCTTTQPATPPPNSAVTSPPPGSIPPVNPVTPNAMPQPDDANLSRGNVYINSHELILRESYPVQVALDISGDLPTPCNQLRVNINAPDADNKILIEVYSVIDSGKTCIQVLAPFQESINLGTFPSGHYTVWVNGDKVGEFDT